MPTAVPAQLNQGGNEDLIRNRRVTMKNSRGSIDNLAAALGLQPSDYSNKRLAIKAIEDEQHRRQMIGKADAQDSKAEETEVENLAPVKDYDADYSPILRDNLIAELCILQWNPWPNEMSMADHELAIRKAKRAYLSRHSKPDIITLQEAPTNDAAALHARYEFLGLNQYRGVVEQDCNGEGSPLVKPKCNWVFFNPDRFSIVGKTHQYGIKDDRIIGSTSRLRTNEEALMDYRAVKVRLLDKRSGREFYAISYHGPLKTINTFPDLPEKDQQPRLFLRAVDFMSKLSLAMNVSVYCGADWNYQVSKVELPSSITQCSDSFVDKFKTHNKQNIDGVICVSSGPRHPVKTKAVTEPIQLAQYYHPMVFSTMRA